MTVFKKNIFWLLIAIAVFIADRLTKLLVVKYLVFNQATEILPFFNLFFTLNPGAAFSFLSDASGWQAWLFIAVGVIASLLIAFWQMHITNNRWLQIALALVLGGTLGNLFDRIFFGYVIDFLDFYYSSSHFPAFNLADSAICIGTAMLVIDMLTKKNK